MTTPSVDISKERTFEIRDGDIMTFKARWLPWSRTFAFSVLGVGMLGEKESAALAEWMRTCRDGE